MDVVELQRKEIERLRTEIGMLTDYNITLLETNANLSTVLGYLTDNKFKAFASADNWRRVICDHFDAEDFE